MAKYTLTVITDHVYPPIPIRSHDWVAHLDDEEGISGWGKSEEDAVADLLTQLYAADEPLDHFQVVLKEDAS